MNIGIWEPIWLDGDGRRLYGGLHMPSSNVAKLGVLLVPPLFHEQPRSRRFVTEVASGLAKLGLPCLRFDFFGTGDSAGTGNQADFATMCADIDLAAVTLRRIAGAERIVVLAWRGGTLPVWSWVRAGGDADLVLLWEPITNGAGWLDELEREDLAERHSQLRYVLRQKVPPATDDGQLMGFDASHRMRLDLAEARLADGEHRLPVWAIVRSDAAALPFVPERTFVLPSGEPAFGGGIRMDTRLCVSRSLERLVDEVGRALLQRAEA